MAPSRAHGTKSGKKNTNVFSASAIIKDKERKKQRSEIKKAKAKFTPKKKLKEQTSRQIETVNDSFNELHSQMVQRVSQEKTRSCGKHVTPQQKNVDGDSMPKCDMSQEQLNEAISNIASL